jgi:chromosome segregation ATPase
LKGVHDDEYLALETQYDALVESVIKCHETINQLSARLDQYSGRISEFENKLNKLELDFAQVGYKVDDLYSEYEAHRDPYLYG